MTGLEDELLDGDAEAIARLRKLADASVPQLGFAIASGRSLIDARALIKQHQLPQPDVYITQLGAEIHYGARQVLDASWEKHLAHRWEPTAIRKTLEKVPGLSLQPEQGRQHRFKISYVYQPGVAPRRREIQRLLREENIPAKVLLSQNQWLDVIPLRSGKGQALRYVALRWGIDADRVLFYARRGSDYEALSGHFLGVLGSDHASELKPTKNLPRVYLSQSPNFMGLLEGIEAYQFGENIRIPDSASGVQQASGAENEAVLQPDLVAHSSESEETES